MRRIFTVLNFVAMVVLFTFALAGLCLADGTVAIPTATTAKTDWLTVISRVFIDLLPIIGTALAGLATWAVQKLVAKLHMDNIAGLQEIVDDAVNKGIHYAEQWAAQQASKPVGSEKMQQCLQFAEMILGNKVVQQYGRDALKKLVDSLLHQQEGDAGPVPVTTITPVAPSA